MQNKKKTSWKPALAPSPPLREDSDFVLHWAIYSLSDANNVNTQLNYQISKCAVAKKKEKILTIGAEYRRKQRQENTYWIARSLGPQDRMNVWHKHNGRGTRRLVQVLVCFSLALSLSELCAKNGQWCLCARQNFNKGVRRWWWWWLKRGRSGGVDGGSMPQ